MSGFAPKALWDAEKGTFDGQPFAELINFSDCEGIIGPKTSAKLRDDFRAFADQIPALALRLFSGMRDPADECNWFLVKYKEWQEAFELAADTGCVEFH